MAELSRGMVLGNTYQIIDIIGSGGGGVVYKSRHLRLETDVVVKKIKDEVRDKLKSRQEADILKRLKHPYLPRVYDFIEAEDGVYTVMDFIQGEDLDTAVKRHGKFSQKDVRKWAEQLGEALDYLHSQNPPIIHSDIKPANIMLTKEGNICLIDFNISLAVGGEMKSAVGISAGFSPPEQYKDPMTYAKVTRNYTMQRSLQMNAKLTVDDKTEVQGNAFVDDRTDISGNGYVDDKTEAQDFDKTDVYEVYDDDKTVVIPDPSATDRPNLQINQVMQSSPRSSAFLQYLGKGIDARSDIYSLGVTLCCMLTGEIPPADFEQRTFVDKAKARVSEGFAVILDKMVEFAPRERYANGSEYLKAIRNSYKLDRRYIAMHRKELAIQIVAVSCVAVGIMVSFLGVNRIRVEKDMAYFGLLDSAEQCISMSDYTTAAGYITQAKEAKITEIDAYEKEVYLQYVSGNYEECIALGQEHINASPFTLNDDSDMQLLGNIYYLVGNAYYELKDYMNAENVFKHALQYNKSNGLFYRDYAIVLAKTGNVEVAQEQLQTAIDLGIAQDSIYMAQGEIAYIEGNREDAINYLKQAINSTTDLQLKKRAVIMCADVYKSIGGDAIDKEIELLDKYRQQFEGNGGLSMVERLAEAYTRKAQVAGDDANQYYEKALALFDEMFKQGYITYNLQQNMAILYQNMNRFDDAENLLLQMVESYPERYEVYKRLAYLEADRQQEKDNINRDYNKMRDYYNLAKDKYSEEKQDMEMSMLDNMMQELEDGGWF